MASVVDDNMVEGNEGDNVNEKVTYKPKYTDKELNSFIDGIRDAGEKMREWNPSYYMIPLQRGLPLFDILTMLDLDIDPDLAFYFPASGKIKDSKKVLTNCYENFLLEKQDEEIERCPISSIDEVVGGHSVEKTFNAYTAACKNVVRHNLRRNNMDPISRLIDEETEYLKNKFPLRVFGIKDTRNLKRMSEKYKDNLNIGNILEFPVDKIITMDDMDYGLIEFKHLESSGSNDGVYYPGVKNILRSEAYENLLKDIAKRIGTDHEKIQLERSRIISDSNTYSKKPEYDFDK